MHPSPLQCGAGAVEPAEAVLWFAGKQMQASKALGDYLGRNEKTRAVVKLMARGAPAPPREPVRTASSDGAPAGQGGALVCIPV